MKRLTPQQIDRELKIGADPEFLLIKLNGEAFYANNLFTQGGATRLGADGGGVAAEVRPVPSVRPKDVVLSIKMSMRNGAQRHPKMLDCKWLAGGSRLHPIGGHIHFGTEAIALEGYDIGRDELASDLDAFLSIPLLSIEDKGEAKYRRSGSYGRLSDMREQPWGCEYRTPGSWITSPEVSLAVLSLAKVVACESLAGRIKAIKSLHEISWDAFRDARIKESITAKSWARIEKMVLYPKYRKAIMVIRRLAEAGRNWHSGDLKDTWSILTPKMRAEMAARLLPATSISSAQIVRLSTVWRDVRSSLYSVSQESL